MIAVAGVSALVSRPGVARMDTWQELSALAEKRLKAVSSCEHGVFAAGVAERLMSWHEAPPEDEQAPCAVSLRPLLNSVWEGVLGDQTAFSAVKRDAAEYMLSEYCHNDGQDGPDDADEFAAAAALHAAHAYLFRCREFAIWTSNRTMEAIDQRLQYLADQEGDDHLPDPDEALAAELQRQLRDLRSEVHGRAFRECSETALPDDLSPDRDPGGEHPCEYVHGYHLLVLSHGRRKSSSGRGGPPNGFLRRAPWPDAKESATYAELLGTSSRLPDHVVTDMNTCFRTLPLGGQLARHGRMTVVRVGGAIRFGFG
ncbi:hypothetical protein [Streptomyces sp. NPDC058086]|uniref:hypothetical protein n=1 Tax=Streptomyces sp. NPDC058086 TaxID=3346334 RepID=UPI0036E63299